MDGPWTEFQRKAPAEDGPWKEFQKPSSVGAPAAPTGSDFSVSGALKAASTGIRQGTESFLGTAGDVGQTLGDLAGRGAEALGASPAAQEKLKNLAGYVGLGGPNVGKIIGDVTGRSDLYPTTSEELHNTTVPLVGENYKPQNRAEKFIKTGAEFLPAAAGGEGNIVKRLITQALIPGAASEAAGQYTEGTAAEPYARVAAALAAPVGLAGARRAVTPFPASAERLNMAKTLADEGVNLTAGQKTGSDKLRFMESELGGSAGQRFNDQQAEQFTSAALKRAGIDAPRATPEVMDQAFGRIGKEFDDLAATTKVPLDATLQNDMLKVVTDYQAVAGTPAPVVESMMNRAAEMAKGTGAIEGEAYKNLRSEIGAFMRKADGPTKQALGDIQGALDDAVERHMPAEHVDRWKEVRRQYKDILVLEQAVAGPGEGAAAGLISPSKLRQATVGQNKRGYVRGKGDFADLARAGEGTMKPLPNSGTAGRLKAQFGGASLSGIVGALLGNTAMPGIGTVVGGAAGAAVPSLVGRALLSGPGRKLAGNQLAGAGDNPTVRAIIAALLAAQNSRPPVNGTPAVAP